jgi:hypothetical protein
LEYHKGYGPTQALLTCATPLTLWWL